MQPEIHGCSGEVNKLGSPLKVSQRLLTRIQGHKQ